MEQHHIPAGVLQYFQEYRPSCEGPFENFNELTLDRGTVHVTMADSLTFSGVHDEPMSVCQWKNRLHINYQARINWSESYSRIVLTPRFAYYCAEHANWVIRNRYSDQCYMRDIHKQRASSGIVSMIPTSKLEDLYPVDTIAWYAPKEWAVHLPCNSTQRLILLRNHEERTHKLYDKNASDDTKWQIINENLVELERFFLHDVAAMREWGDLGQDDMTRIAHEASAFLIQQDESRLVWKPQWTTPRPFGVKTFINLSPWTTMILHNQRDDLWHVHGKNFDTFIPPGATMTCKCDQTNVSCVIESDYVKENK
jgi:hypothetical protein